MCSIYYMISRNSRTPSEYIGYGLYLYFSGLSLRKATALIDYQIALSKEIMFLSGTDGFKNIILKKYPTKKKKISEYVIDETVIKVGPEYIWVWVAY